jgi:hypothetical protein
MSPRPRLTDREVTQRLADKAQSIFSTADDCFVYVDTVAILLPRRLTSQEYLRIQGTCRDLDSWPTQIYGMASYTIQQPTISTLRLITLLFPDHIVTLLDIAIDFVSENKRTVSRIKNFLHRYVTQPRRGNSRIAVHKGTVYFCRRGARRNIALYDSKPSKITGLPAAHLELRYRTARICKSRGIKKLTDLENFQISSFIDRDLRISDINWSKADRIVERAAALFMRQFNKRQRDKRRRNRSAMAARRMNRPSARKSFENSITRFMDDGDRSPTWADLPGYPVQQCIDCYRVLQRATINASLVPLISKPLHLF